MTAGLAGTSDLALALRPFTGYAARAQVDQGVREAALAVVRILFVLGAFVSFTTAGRLVPFHVVSGMLFYAFLPVIQIAAFAASWALWVRKGTLARAVSLFVAGHGPFLSLGLLVTLGCAVPSLAHELAVRGIAWRALPVLLLVTIVWSVVLTFACFRAGLGTTKARAALAALTYYAVEVGILAAWYGLTGQLRAFA